MSLWEFLMCIEGWKLANGGAESSDGGGTPKPPTEAQFEAFVAKYADQ